MVTLLAALGLVLGGTEALRGKKKPSVRTYADWRTTVMRLRGPIHVKGRLSHE